MADFSNKYGLHKGSMVAVHIDPYLTQFPSYATKRYNGTVQKVSKVVTFGAWGTYFELEGVTSRKGTPYGFTINELKKVEL